LFNQDGRWAAVNYQQQEVHWLIGSIKSAAAALLKKKKEPSAGAEEYMGDDQSAKKSVGDETGSKRDAAAVSTAMENTRY